MFHSKWQTHLEREKVVQIEQHQQKLVVYNHQQHLLNLADAVLKTTQWQ
jgi:hypothetical protein